MKRKNIAPEVREIMGSGRGLGASSVLSVVNLPFQPSEICLKDLGLWGATIGRHHDPTHRAPLILSAQKMVPALFHCG